MKLIFVKKVNASIPFDGTRMFIISSQENANFLEREEPSPHPHILFPGDPS
jgi:hypothetical protein